jgi:hypothetical protein
MRVNMTALRNYFKVLHKTESTDYFLWKETKKRKHDKRTFPATLDITGTWAQTNVAKANAFAEH